MFYKQIKNVLFIYFWCTCLQALGYSEKTTMASTRANTLSDDADDIQRQLDNEARDRMKFGRPQTIWILHYPTKPHVMRELTTTETMKRPWNYECKQNNCHKHHGTECVTKLTGEAFGLFEVMPSLKNWTYKDQVRWHLSHPSCGGRSQSPVDLPRQGLLHTPAPRQILFRKYDVEPKNMMLVRVGETVSISGEWGSDRPWVYGGAAHSRRYVFHSLALRHPSEHSVGGLHYPLESQAIHVSVEYATLQEALRAAPKDKSALLVVANIYKHSNKNDKDLEELVQALTTSSDNTTLMPLPLKAFSPPLTEYAAYHGSLTTPPCTEAVLWLVRARALPITRNLVDVLENKNKPGEPFNRLVQPLNDRKIYYFN